MEEVFATHCPYRVFPVQGDPWFYIVIKSPHGHRVGTILPYVFTRSRLDTFVDNILDYGEAEVPFTYTTGLVYTSERKGLIGLYTRDSAGDRVLEIPFCRELLAALDELAT